MTGLLLLAVAGLWLVAALFISVFVGRKLPKRPWRVPMAVVLFLVLVPLPLADEFIGRQQFKTLCEKYAVQFVDVQHAQGRSVLFVPRTKDEYVQGTAVRIRIDPHEYRDAGTGKVLVSYHTLHANGGWLIRALGISESNHPLLFNSSCGPNDQDGFKKKFNVTVVN
ncbi:MAG: hypothetical protein AAB353_05165 [Candidatus Hydrogenedentota bacterium]